MCINWSKLVDVDGCIESSSQQSSTAVGIMSSVPRAAGGSLLDRRSRVRVSDAKSRLAGGGGHDLPRGLVVLRTHSRSYVLFSLWLFSVSYLYYSSCTSYADGSLVIQADNGNVACMEAFVVASVRMSYRATVGDDDSCKEVAPYSPGDSRLLEGGRCIGGVMGMHSCLAAKHSLELDGAAARKTPKSLVQVYLTRPSAPSSAAGALAALEQVNPTPIVQAAKSHQANKAGRIHPRYPLPLRQRIPPLSSSFVGCPAPCFSSRDCRRHGQAGTTIELKLTATQSLEVLTPPTYYNRSKDELRRNPPRTPNDALFLSLYPKVTYLPLRRPMLPEVWYAPPPSYIRD
ncbi:hypothetical protein GE21DRAFT_5043 [Neurospora crassa]|uniref:Uncharacterized protein n=1 Tax=Neurospora crassa (strain ATCC 24698 / 74-OR23-1A / CBS 708.71 / DSM 1257 / FGSC 987) TaxID=367110 RepID=Q7S3I4_NEUCR|nr:hypothetical protein NCU08259 [Neurospora crassa OR74A]EAA30113.2 hypothetical protein NCU08259 [Neurospora crassa OR74A]KHE86519.1 hypothetical protein GE21DRAFT_5043 [Neurospora crassa]|eukprot:XP_959349.2 hypothetical protein NCU08259 [Neurospora crassa OR74A]